MTIERQFSKGVAWMAAGSWIEQAFNFLIFVILARLLGAEALGLAAMAVSFLVLAASIVRETFTEFLIARKDATAEDHNAVFWCLIGVAVTIAALLIGLSQPISKFYGEPQVAQFLVALSPVVLMIAFTAVPVAILRREMRFNILSIRAIAGVVVGGVVGVVMALSGFGVWALIVQYLALIATNAVLAWFAVDWRPGRPPPLSHIRKVAAFGTQVIGLRTAELTATQAPLVMVGATLGASALGQFSIAWRLIEIGSILVVTPLRLTSQSAFAAISRAGGSAAALLRNLMDVISLVALPAFVGLAVLAPYVIPAVFGPGWDAAIPVLQIMCAAGLFFCFEKVQQAFCLAAGKAGQVTIITWIEALLGVALIWAFADQGVLFVAAVFSLRYFLLWPFRFAIVARLGGLSFGAFLARVATPLAVTVVMGIAVYATTALLDWSVLATLIAGIAVGGLVFVLLTTVFMRPRVELAIRLAKGQTDG